MNKLFRYTAAAVLVASFGMLGNYTADAAKFLESPREVHIVKPEFLRFLKRLRCHQICAYAS